MGVDVLTLRQDGEHSRQEPPCTTELSQPRRMLVKGLIRHQSGRLQVIGTTHDGLPARRPKVDHAVLGPKQRSGRGPWRRK